MRAGIVYDWERNNVEPKDVGLLSREDVRTLVSSSARHLGIQAPEVRFVKASSSPCKAVISAWRIDLSDWGRTRVTVLHEMAHFGSLSSIRAGEDPHGPGFMAAAIDLYARFIGVDRNMMIASAERLGIRIGAPPSQKAPHRFMDVDF